MIIGYTVNPSESELRRLKLDGRCEEVHEVGLTCIYYEKLATFLKEHVGDTVVVVELSSLGVSISSWIKLSNLLEECQIDLRFLEKELLTDQEYIQLLKKISEVERLAVSQRTRAGLEKAKLEGRIGGRPSIDLSKVTKIEELYMTHKKPLREIAEIAEVSLGTVHKYVNLIDFDKFER